MPETILTVKWPDGEIESIYSPSTIIKKYFEPGEELDLIEFEKKSKEAFEHASKRVEMVRGFSCTAAMSSLHGIKSKVGELAAQEKAVVTIIDVS